MDNGKPCKNCGVNVTQAILYDEVDCFKSCEKWQKWSKQRKGCGILQELCAVYKPTIE